MQTAGFVNYVIAAGEAEVGEAGLAVFGRPCCAPRLVARPIASGSTLMCVVAQVERQGDPGRDHKGHQQVSYRGAVHFELPANWESKPAARKLAQ